jgi:hypothetical protein
MELDANHRPPVHDLALVRGAWAALLTLAGTFWSKVEIATLRHVPTPEWMGVRLVAARNILEAR